MCSSRVWELFINYEYKSFILTCLLLCNSLYVKIVMFATNQIFFHQEIYKKPPPKKKRNFDRDGRGGGHNNHDKGNNKRKMQSRDHNPDQPKKKPLLKTPMEERPICRFYKEGKCQKVKIFRKSVMIFFIVHFFVLEIFFFFKC